MLGPLNIPHLALLKADSSADKCPVNYDAGTGMETAKRSGPPPESIPNRVIMSREEPNNAGFGRCPQPPRITPPAEEAGAVGSRLRTRPESGATRAQS